MKLATYKDGSRDGQLVVVSRDLTHRPLRHRHRHAHATGAGRLELHRAAAAGPVGGAEPRQDAPCVPVRARAVHGSAAARVPVGRRLRLPQPRGTGAQGARRRDARELLRRPADVPGRQPTTSSGPCDPATFASTRTGASTSRARWPSSPATSRWARARNRRSKACASLMLANDWSLRNLIPAELGKGFGFLQEQACHGVQSGGRHARRTRRRLAWRPRAPAADSAPGTAARSAPATRAPR